LGCLLDVAWSARFDLRASGALRALFATPDGRDILARGLRWGLGIGIPHAQAALAEALVGRDATLARALALVALGRPLESVTLLDGAGDRAGELRLIADELRLLLVALGLPGLGDDTGAARARLEEWRADPRWGPRARRVLAVVDEPAREPTFASDTVSPFVRAVRYGRWAATREPAEAVRWWRWYENSDLTGWPEGRLHSAEVDWALETYGRVRGGVAALEAGDRALGCRLLRDVPGRWRNAEPALSAWRAEAADALATCDG
jgi:hypothetical protein